MPTRNSLTDAVLRRALAAGLAACVAGASAAPAAERLPERAFGPLGLRAETAVREAHPGIALKADFHRAQSFSVRPSGGAGDAPWRVVSLAWWPESGGDARCVLALFAADDRAPVLVDPMDDRAGADRLPWSCDGEPALRFLDAPGCPRVLALYPMRPPSGERFLLPTVIGCAEGRKPALDRAATKRLREAVIGGAKIDSLAAMQRALAPPRAEVRERK